MSKAPVYETAKPTRAGVYLRISDDREHTEAGVTRQEQDCRTLARQRGWDVTEVYRENDTSAFKRRKVALPDGTTAMRVVRPEFRRMLDDLAAGRIDALIGYHLDRVARDPRDLEDLIDAVETTGRPAVTVGGAVDLSSDGGITLARVAVAVANQSSRDASRRIRRAKEASAANGRWNGGGIRAYGYTRDRTEIITAEAATIRELAQRTLAGQSTNSILDDLNTRQVPTVTPGGTWKRATVKRILTSGVAAGRLRHRGHDIGPATWPPILDADTHHALLAHYAARPRNDTTLRHWLTGVAICGRCGHTLRGNSGAYLCSRDSGGCNGIWVKADHLEDLLEHALIRRAVRRASPKVTRREAVDDSQLADLAAMWGAQEIGLDEYRAARAQIVARLRTASAKVVRVPAWVTGDVAVAWQTWTPAQKNATAKAYLEAVVVNPCPDRRWRPERVAVTWR